MNLSRILGWSPRQQEHDVENSVISKLVEPSTSLQVPQRGQRSTEVKREIKRCSVMCDKDRKMPYRMSSTQRQLRQDHKTHESRVFNLMLDINDLRQQIQYLTERRDLYTTRLLLHRQQIQSQVIEMTWDLLSSYRGDAYGLAPSGRGCYLPTTQPESTPSRGVLQFVMKSGRPVFSHRAFLVNSVRVLAAICDDDVGEHASEIRQVCGAGGGCIVEVLAPFTGRIIRDTLSTMLPSILSDEALTSQLIGSKVTFLARLLFYFDNERRLVKQVMQADIVAAFNALHISGMDDFAELARLTANH